MIRFLSVLALCAIGLTFNSTSADAAKQRKQKPTQEDILAMYYAGEGQKQTPEQVLAAALSDEASFTKALIEKSGVNTNGVTAVEYMVVLDVVRFVKLKKHDELALRKGVAAKLFSAANSDLATLIGEIAYNFWLRSAVINPTSGVAENEEIDCFARGFLLSGYVATWGKPHVNEQCKKRVVAEWQVDMRNTSDAYAMLADRIRSECTIIDEAEQQRRWKLFCAARAFIQTVIGYDILTCK